MEAPSIQASRTVQLVRKPQVRGHASRSEQHQWETVLPDFHRGRWSGGLRSGASSKKVGGPLGFSCQRESPQSDHFLLSGCARACPSILTIRGSRDDSDGKNIRSAPPFCQFIKLAQAAKWAKIGFQRQRRKGIKLPNIIHFTRWGRKRKCRLDFSILTQTFFKK